MTLNQKIDWVKDLLSGEHSLRNRNDFYIPTQDIPANIDEHFWEILQKFEREGLVKKAYLGFAGFFDDERKPEVFKTIGEDGSIPEVSYEDGNGKKKIRKLLPTYYIEIDATKLDNAKTQRATREEVEFDPLSGVISFEKINYAFHKKGDKTRRNFFRQLWGKRKIKKAEVVKRKGELTPPETVATNLDFIDSAQMFDRSSTAKDKLDALDRYPKIKTLFLRV